MKNQTEKKKTNNDKNINRFSDESAIGKVKLTLE
jgi:hypothetical protein